MNKEPAPKTPGQRAAIAVAAADEAVTKASVVKDLYAVRSSSPPPPFNDNI